MTTRTVTRVLIVAAAVIGLTAVTRQASASGNNYNWRVVAKVPGGLNPDDLHIVFTGTGGTINKENVQAPPGTASVSGGGNTVDVTLNAKAVPGTDVVITFVTAHSPIQALNAKWTNGGDSIGVSVVDSVLVSAGSVPAASDGLLVALALLMLSVGAFAIARRRENTA